MDCRVPFGIVLIYVWDGAFADAEVSAASLLSQLCVLYLPLCDLRDGDEAYAGVFNGNRTAGADFGFHCAGADGNRGASGDVCAPSLFAVFSGSGMEEKHPAGILANSVKLWYDTLRFAGLEGRPA